MAERLLTGGSGLLGGELRKLMAVDAPTHEEFDVLHPKRDGDYDVIIHAAAYTDVAKAEVDKDSCTELNVQGTLNLLLLFSGVPFVYISTEYARNPVNHYGRTKLEAEDCVRVYAERYLILRTLFKPNPYPWDKAFIDQFTQGDYVDVIARLIAKEIEEWDKQTCRNVYVGTGRKTMFELAQRTRPDVKPNSIKDIKDVSIPADYL
jgi:dTDP-4-dehydrorhamnose reductase